MSIRHILQYYMNLVVEKISQNKSVVQTPIIYFMKEKKNMYLSDIIALTLMKSGTPFFRIDIMYMIYLDVKNFSAVCLGIYNENQLR